MKAMILAAGFGTRLKPLTEKIPKALVEHKGSPMIVNTIEYLKKFGVTNFVINTHHHSEMMNEFFENYNSDAEIKLIYEEEILGTGGGILNAADYLSDEEFFIVMNADIETDFNLSGALKFQSNFNPFATIIVQDRSTTRKLSFDDDMNLTGRASDNTKNNFAFNGIHIISNEIFKCGYETGYRDIIDIYITETGKGKTIKGYDAGNSYFIDLGKIENLKSLN